MKTVRSSLNPMATLRNPAHMMVNPKTRRAARRAALALSIAALGATVNVGCQRMQTTQPFPPPPGMISSSMAATNQAIANASVSCGSTADSTSTFVAARPAQQPLSQNANDQFVVRGQDSGGFVLPSLPDISADGGRHNRDPLPVSGQRTTVAQAPGGYPSTAPMMSEPFVAPNSAAAPQGNTPFGVSPPTTSQPGFGLQPGYDVLPEISSESLTYDPSAPIGIPYEPITRTADIIVNGYPARTGRIMFGGAVNSDAGVTGQITVEERNFDITRWPTSFGDLIGGTAFRGAGQTLRIEAVPGNQFQRYSVNFTEPFLFGYMPISMSLSGFLFDRRFQDWDEQRLGGRVNFGYRITPDLSISAGVRGEQVDVTRPRILGIPQLDEVLGENEIYSGQMRLTHDTRNSPFAPSEGHYMEFTYEQAFGGFDFPRFEASYNRYFLVRERADGSGRQTFTTGLNVGVSGEDTPIFENFFAGGYTTLRGFEFRGASPSVQGVQVGGRFQLLGTFEYMFPLTADDMLRAVAFVDYGTVEDDVRLDRNNFRLAPGVGLRIAVPALGPAPLAFDFAFPVMDAAGDEQQSFSFYMGLTRRM